MKTTFYKNAALTFFILNLWTVVQLFIYLMDKNEFLRGLLNLGIFQYTMFLGLMLGCIVLLLRFVWQTKIETIKASFFYLFSGILNAYLVLIYIALIYFKIILNSDEFLYTIVVNGIISLIILLDYFFVKKVNSVE